MTTIIIILICILIIFVFKNFTILKELSISKEYRNIYKSVLSKEDNVIDKINTYINKEKDPYLLNKAKVLLLFLKARDKQDVLSLIDDINFNEIFFRNGKYNENHINLNSDMFIWLMVTLPCLKETNNLDALYNRLNQLDGKINSHLEYLLFKAIYSFLKDDNDGSKFLYDLVSGDYSGLNYDKQMIGVVKRIAMAYIACKSQDVNEEFKDELAVFASTYIGLCLLQDLNIYEVYKKNESE